MDTFEDAGFPVLETCDASEAIKLIDMRGISIEVLLTDIRLGKGPDGWDIARHTRSKLHDIAVVFVSGDSAKDWSEAGIDKSVMLAKPFADGDVLAAVRNGLAGTEASSSGVKP